MFCTKCQFAIQVTSQTDVEDELAQHLTVALVVNLRRLLGFVQAFACGESSVV